MMRIIFVRADLRYTCRHVEGFVRKIQVQTVTDSMTLGNVSNIYKLLLKLHNAQHFDKMSTF